MTECVKPLTNVELLAAVRQAIFRVLTTGQSTSFNGESYTKADLNSLTQAERYYEQKVAADAVGEDGQKRARNRIIYAEVK